MITTIDIRCSSTINIVVHGVLIERNSLSVDDNIYAPPWGLSTLAKELSAAPSVMQSSS